jgi:hypothetical protein
MCLQLGFGFGIAVGRRKGQYNAWRFASASIICASDDVTSCRIGIKLLDGGRQGPERLALICHLLDLTHERNGESGKETGERGEGKMEKTIRDKRRKKEALFDSTLV